MIERFNPGSGTNPKIPCLGDFKKDADKLEPEAFARVHGDAYFLHFGPIEDLRPPARSLTTVMAEPPRASGKQAFNPQADFLVFPFRLRPEDQSRGTLVWVGRGARNDVVIPDASVSAIQAFIRAESDGNFFLQDMRSANGSFINDKRVPELGMGDPVRFRSSDRLRFGQVSLTFLLVKDFHVLVTRLVS